MCIEKCILSLKEGIKRIVLILMFCFLKIGFQCNYFKYMWSAMPSRGLFQFVLAAKLWKVADLYAVQQVCL